MGETAYERRVGHHTRFREAGDGIEIAVDSAFRADRARRDLVPAVREAFARLRDLPAGPWRGPTQTTTPQASVDFTADIAPDIAPDISLDLARTPSSDPAGDRTGEMVGDPVGDAAQGPVIRVVIEAVDSSQADVHPRQTDACSADPRSAQTRSAESRSAEPPSIDRGRSGPRHQAVATAGPLPSFESFAVGESNRLGHRASLRLAEASDSETMGMLFIHGPSGVGKTHLLGAIARRFSELNPTARTALVTADAFVGAFISAINGRRMEAFRRRYRGLRLLAIDDAHEFARKGGTQEELLHTLNQLELGGARVVLTSDAPPAGIGDLSQALASRFAAGAVVRIDPPDRALRRELIARFVDRAGLLARPEAIAALEAELDRLAARRGQPVSAREIEGIARQLATTAHAIPGLLDQSGRGGVMLVEQTMRQREGRAPGPPSPRLRHSARVEPIAHAVADELGVSLDELRASGRHPRVVLARGLVVHLARQLTTKSYPEIARAMGRTAHSFAVMAHQRVKAQIEAGQPADVGCPHDGMALASLVDLLLERLARDLVD